MLVIKLEEEKIKMAIRNWFQLNYVLTSLIYCTPYLIEKQCGCGDIVFKIVTSVHFISLNI